MLRRTTASRLQALLQQQRGQQGQLPCDAESLAQQLERVVSGKLAGPSGLAGFSSSTTAALQHFGFMPKPGSGTSLKVSGVSCCGADVWG